eukprot:PhM_4_TR9378/c0_g1_i1/m.69067/K12384/SCARB2, LIMP2, CD36L2; lysosome membrane protein 2
MAKSNTLRFVFLCLGVFFLIAGALVYALIPKMIEEALKNGMKWEPDTVEDSWYNASKDIDMWGDFYMYNCTNPDEVELGAVPKLTFLGPYSYKRIVLRKRDSVKWYPNNGTVRWQKKIDYYFNSERSQQNGRQLREDDNVYIFNFPLNTLAIQASQMCALGDNTMWYAIPMLQMMTQSKMFMKMTAREAIMGHNNPLLAAVGMNPFISLGAAPIDELIDDEYMTGQGPLNAPGYEARQSVAWITMRQGMRMQPYWRTPELNKVEGFDGQFPPYEAMDEKELPLWGNPLYRRTPFEYDRDVELHGLTLKRYRVANRVQHAVNPDTYQTYFGFYNAPPITGLPFSVTKGMFYDADWNAINLEINGRNPIVPPEDEHNFHLDVQPHSGFPFRVNNRLQLNTWFGPVTCNGTAMPFTAKYSPTAMPMLASYEITAASEDDVDDFIKLLFLPMRLSIGFGIAGIVIGCVGIVAVGVSFAVGGNSNVSPAEGATRIDSPTDDGSPTNKRNEATRIPVMEGEPSNPEADVRKDEEMKEVAAKEPAPPPPSHVVESENSPTPTGNEDELQEVQ